MSERPHIEPVEDYTQAFLVSFGALIFFGLFIVWAIWGLMASLTSGWVVDRSIAYGGQVAERRRAARGPKRW